MNERVVLNDVGPRDGLQNQPVALRPDQRLALIGALVDAGMPAIEVGSFVSPKAVPAMAGTDEVFAGLPAGTTEYTALIPNMKGYQLGRRAGARRMALVVASTDAMNVKNIGATVAESMAVCEQVIAQGAEDGIGLSAYIATAWECPFEGPVAAGTVCAMARALLDAGAERIVLADTIGAAAPRQVKARLSALAGECDTASVACHFHDTRGMGVANVYAALEAGVRRFDASIGGMGGCPFAPGAAGNVATEDVALLLEQCGCDTGVDVGGLLAAADLARELTGHCPGGHASRWLRQRVESVQTEGAASAA